MDIFDDLPGWLKAGWLIGAGVTLAFWIFIIWVIIKLWQHWSII